VFCFHNILIDGKLFITSFLYFEMEEENKKPEETVENNDSPVEESEKVEETTSDVEAEETQPEEAKEETAEASA